MHALSIGICLLSAPSFSFAKDSNFIGFRSKCKYEEAHGPETAPQSPPLSIDDPETPGCNHIEINLTFDGDFAKGEASREVPLLDLNYGIGDNLQLKYEIPRMNDTQGDETTSDWGGSKVGLKYHFYGNEQQELNISVYPQIEWVESKSEHGHIMSLPVLLSQKLGQTALGDVIFASNLGYHSALKLDTKDFLTISVGLGAPLTKDIGIMGELSSKQALGRLPNEKREQLVFANLGFMLTMSASFKLYASAGSSVASSDDKHHVYALAGLRWNSEDPGNPDDGNEHETRRAIP